MVFSKHILSVMAGAGAAYAASCSSSSTTVVQNQGDATTIGACTTYKGDIHINANAGPTLDFGGIQQISGELSMDSDSQLTSLTLASLTELGSLSLTNITSLATLTMSSLKTVGDMTLENLPILSSWNFGTNLTKAGSVSIENVQITELGAIATASELDAVTVSNCQYLANINFAVSSIGSVDIGPNNVGTQTVSLPSLTSADTLTFRNSTKVDTPMLSNVADTLSLIGNTFTSYSAVNLTWAGAIVFADNPKLTNISFPSLVQVNGSNATLNIQNNTDLSSVMGFSKLQGVNGDAIFAGNINNISLPALTSVIGAVTVDTTSSTFDCTNITNYSNSVAHGKVTCTTGDPTPTGSSGTSSGSGSSSSSKSAAHVELPPFMTAGFFASLLVFLA